MKTILMTYQNELLYLKRIKAHDAENRCRAKNVCFVGVPERSEKANIVGFLARLIPHLLGGESFATPRRAHHSPGSNSSSNARSSRTILAKFLHFEDKVKILRLAWEKKRTCLPRQPHLHLSWLQCRPCQKNADNLTRLRKNSVQLAILYYIRGETLTKHRTFFGLPPFLMTMYCLALPSLYSLLTV